ncbi:hypothetical protein RA280_23305 [Cupriavidus sp. CV2]|uniref:hypothetical protein n=1 Tax=Cupriavidus ulmosensis TaxID=3065913 RepID=UPI00296AB637|nr:hypothetical protein [Cupriavidus sp. CV2]MDW3684619.1 hypothetical protein [Cupriavidus sp. CV2]
MKHRAIGRAIVGTLFCAVSSAFAAANVDIGVGVPGVARAEPTPVYVAPRPVYVVVPSSRYSPYRGESEQREEYWRERRWREQEEHSDQGHRIRDEHSQHGHGS